MLVLFGIGVVKVMIKSVGDEVAIGVEGIHLCGSAKQALARL